MNERQRQKQFSKTMTYLIKEAESDTFGAPVSGNVGEDCLGYITDPGGRLFRLHKYQKTDSDIGPGSYNTDITSFDKSKGITIGNRPKPEKKPDKFPGFYDTKQKNTRILHSLPPRETVFNPFKKERQRSDYSIPSTSQVKERKSQPNRWRPQAKVSQQRGSYQFSSTIVRDPFNLRHVEVKPPTKTPPYKPMYYDTENYDYYLNGQPPRDFRSAIFKSKTDRVVFEQKQQTSPDPTAYTLPDTIGRCNGYDFRELFPEGEKVEEDVGPAPGQYDIELKTPIQKKSIKPKDYTLSYPRNMKKPEPLLPGPCEFQKYESPLYNTRPSTIFSRHLTANEEWTKSFSEAPGPGTYNLTEASNQKHTPGFQYHTSKSQLSNERYLF